MTRLKLAFAANMPEMINHYESIIDQLPHRPDILICKSPSAPDGVQIAAMAERKGCPVVWATEAPANIDPYDAVISNHMHVLDGSKSLLRFGRRHIRLMYSLGFLHSIFRDSNIHYDAALCYGPYQQKIFASLFPKVKTAAVGYTRLDAVKGQGETSDRRETIISLGGDPNKKLLLWLPTLGELCSLEIWADQLIGANMNYNIIVKPHPLTLSHSPATIERLKRLGFTIIEDQTLNNARLMQLSDFVLADYGGSLFAAIHLDRNIVLLNMTGDMFSEAGPLSPEIHMRDHFVNIEPGQAARLPQILQDELLWQDQQEIRQIYRKYLFADIAAGEAGRQAAMAIMRFAAEPPVSPKACGPAGQLSPELARIVPPNVLKRRFERPLLPTIMWGAYKIMELNAELKQQRESFRNMGILKFARRRLRRFFKGIKTH